MEHARFVHEVRERAGLETDEEVETAVQAALTTLSERVPDEEARNLAEQVPHEIGEHLTAADDLRSFGYDEYVTRVMEREELDADRDAAERHAQAVVGVLVEAVTPRQGNDILPYLSEDYEQLFALVDADEVWGPGWRERLGERG